MPICTARLRTAALAAALSGGLALGGLGCSAAPASLTTPCGVIVDGSDSGVAFNASARLHQLLPGFLQEHSCGTVTIVPLNASSQGSVCVTPSVQINPDLGSDVSPQSVEAERREFAVSQAQRVLTCAHDSPGLADGSDVLGAFKRAVAQRPTGAGTYDVLVVSDLIEVGDGVNLYDGGSIKTRAQRSAIIASLSKNGVIPNMSGIALEISNRGTGLRSDTASDNVTAFWNKLFTSQAAGNPQVTYDT
jgi:hypothetical protein